MRAMWTGEIAFGLVSIPVKMYTATRDLAPQFHLLHKKCGTRVQNVRRCPHCNVDVAWEDVGKGYELSKGKYALFTKEELAEVGEESAPGGIDIAEFVAPDDIDPAYLEKSYWIGPGGKSTRGYELLRTALEKSKKVALAKVKIRTRTRLAILRPREGRFALDMMRYADELVPSKDLEIPPAKAGNARELDLALHLIEQLTGPFDPAKHPDEYRAAVAAAVEEKVEKNEVSEEDLEARERATGEGGGEVINLADMLARSLKATGEKGATVKKARVPKEETAETEEAAKPAATGPAPKKARGASSKGRAA